MASLGDRELEGNKSIKTTTTKKPFQEGGGNGEGLGKWEVPFGGHQFC